MSEHRHAWEEIRYLDGHESVSQVKCLFCDAVQGPVRRQVIQDQPLPFGPAAPESAVSTAKPRACTHHKSKRTFDGTQWVCSCGHVIDPAKQKAGRNARSRNLRIQRQRQRAIGIENIPGNGPYDGRSEMFRSESKAMMPSRFPNTLWTWLRGIPVTTETPILIVTDTPGPGLRARSIVVIDYDDWRDLHGGKP